ncbi:MAG: ABC transporter substrate-binding protein [Nitrosopumilus sp.]|nr:ABC transporter substrate-binding protein [Nitrosopumilus sp.]
MKSRQLLSIVFSLIMFTGVTAGSAATAFAESDDLDDILEDFCEMTIQERADIVADYELDEYADKLAIICEMDDEDEREDSLEDVIDAIDFEARDIEDDIDEIDDDKYETDDYDLDDLLDEYCEMTANEQRQLLADHPRLAPFTDRLANYCDLSEDDQDAIDELIEEHEDKIRYQLREYEDEYRKNHNMDMREHLTRYCEMSDADKRAFVAENDKAEDHVDKMNRYCELDEDGKADFIEEHKDEYREHMKEKMMDKKKHHMDYDRLCAMAEQNRAAVVDDAEKLERISQWCEMTPEEREDYKKERHDAMDKTDIDKKKHHMDYDKLCNMAEPNRAAVVDDAEKLERISQWCEMTPEEREDYKKERHDKTNNEKHEMKMKLSEKSDRIKAMIMDKRDVSDERTEEIKMKYIKKHGDLTDKQKSELKTKFEKHMKTIKHKISDERKSAIHERLAEMKAFKAELREKSPDLTDEEKQQLREEFIERAKDMQLAWITPRTQMTAGVDAAEVQCREGFSLAMKASNGVAMCLKADTALKMIDRGIAVPAN